MLQLRGRFRAAAAACAADPDAEPDELDAAKGIARLWVEVGEAYSTLIASGALSGVMFVMRCIRQGAITASGDPYCILLVKSDVSLLKEVLG